VIIPVQIGTTGMVTNVLKKNLEAMPGKHSIDSLQKTAILRTSHIIRKARGGVDNFLARPGRKEATAIKLGIIQHTPQEAQYTS